MSTGLENVRQIVESALHGTPVERNKIDKMVRDLSDRVEAVREQASRDAYRSGWDEGYQEGYDEGVSQSE